MIELTYLIPLVASPHFPYFLLIRTVSRIVETLAESITLKSAPKFFPRSSTSPVQPRNLSFPMSPELKAQIVFGLSASVIGIIATIISIRQYCVLTQKTTESFSYPSAPGDERLSTR
jgi:hypothetical protein